MNATKGVGGCLMSVDYMKPTDNGNVLYLSVDGIDAALHRAQQAGGRIALGKTPLPGDLGHFAHIIDSEGNRVGLHAAGN
jgi:predicted enzyme related to lactoylglutathione lyase